MTDDGTIVASKQVFTDENDESIEFEWRAEWVTPDMRQAVGSVVMEWSMIDMRFSQLCQFLWVPKNSTDKLSRAFDFRANFIENTASKLYANEPDEAATFSWFMQRLKSVNGSRDDICHGLPGKITRRGRQFDGLLVPFPGRDDKYIPKQLKDIVKLASEIADLCRELNLMSYPLWAAQQFALSGIPIRQVENGTIPSTAHSRSPKLPRLKPLPKSWQQKLARSLE